MRFLTLVVALFVVAMISQVTDVAQNSASVVEADTGVRFMVVDAATGRSDVTVGPEGQARVKIIAEGAQAIAGAQFHMTFAPSMIRVNASSVLPGNLGTGSLFEHNVDNAQGRLSIAFARPSPVGAHSFTVAEAELTVNVAAGECTLLSIHELIVVNGSVPPAQVPATVSDGSVCNRVSKPVEQLPTYVAYCEVDASPRCVTHGQMEMLAMLTHLGPLRRWPGAARNQSGAVANLLEAAHR